MDDHNQAAAASFDAIPRDPRPGRFNGQLPPQQHQLPPGSYRLDTPPLSPYHLLLPAIQPLSTAPPAHAGDGSSGATPHHATPPSLASRFAELSLEQLRAANAEEPGREQYHAPTNLIFALSSESGLLSETFQWKGEEGAQRDLPGFSPQEKTRVDDKLAELLLHLVRLADACGVDLSAAALRQLAAHEEAYPADQCRASPGRSFAEFARRRPSTRDAAPPGSHGQADRFPDIGATPAAPPPSYFSSAADDAMKRKRFSEEQLRELRRLAEHYTWSLSAIPPDVRDRVCAQIGISKERLQNFFNNRKPKDFKKLRTGGSISAEDMEQADAAEQLQMLQHGYDSSGANSAERLGHQPPQYPHHPDHPPHPPPQPAPFTPPPQGPALPQMPLDLHGALATIGRANALLCAAYPLEGATLPSLPLLSRAAIMAAMANQPSSQAFAQQLAPRAPPSAPAPLPAAPPLHLGLGR